MSVSTKARIPRTMKAAAIDRFGGPEVLRLRPLPVPAPRDHEVLIRLTVSGIGEWDPDVREGDVPQEGANARAFPQIIGSDGAGTVVAVGRKVERFKEGDRVYAFTMAGGFYAEYNAVHEDLVAAIPAGLRADEAGALGADGITALRGLVDQLRLRRGESLLIFGASGGIGHIALQLAKRLGARVLAVASGEDGMDLCRRLRADAIVDGHRGDVKEAARAFAPGGVDAALVLAAGDNLAAALHAVKKGGRVAHPNGVEPIPKAPTGVKVLPYDGEPDRDAFDRLNHLIGDDPFHVELGRVYRLEDAVKAHREIRKHHLGKLAFRI